MAALAASVRSLCPGAPILRGAAVVTLDDPAAVRGRRALVIEDGPTLTHGGMSHGAGLFAGIRPVVRVRYDYAEMDTPGLGAAIDAFLSRHGLAPGRDQAAGASR